MTNFTPSLRSILLSVVALTACGSTAKADLPDVLQYPQAKLLGATSSTGVMESAVLLSDDSLEKVLTHYEKVLAVRIGSLESQGEVDDGKVVQMFVANEDSKQAFTGDKYPPRDVQLFTVTKLTKTEVMSLVISRAKTDKQTHIVATWLKR